MSAPPFVPLAAPPTVVTATIATSASLSGAVHLGSTRPAAVYIPADTEGASVTFQASWDGVTYANVHDADGELEINFTDPCILILPLEKFLWAPYIKIRTGTSGTPTTQSGADATLTVIGA